VVKGLGNDIIEIQRIKAALERQGKSFLDKIFTREEQEYCLSYNEPERSLAGRFAAKEAVLKALGTGIIPGVSWLDIAITKDALGKPSVVLSSRLMERFCSPTILISISHCRTYATAVALLV